MFPQKQEQKTPPQKTEKQFMKIDRKTNWIWWKEQISYLFISTKQITEVKLIPATDNSFNIYARIDLKDRFEYFLIDNKKTISAAIKLAEEFTKMIQEKPNLSETDISSNPSEEIKKTEELNGLEALIKLKENLKN